MLNCVGHPLQEFMPVSRGSCLRWGRDVIMRGWHSQIWGSKPERRAAGRSLLDKPVWASDAEVESDDGTDASARTTRDGEQSPLARDRYGRKLVTLGQTNVNHELLKAGLAWHFTRYDKSKELAELDAAARKSKVDLWADPAPIAPWDWRATEAERKKANPKRPSRASPARRD